MDPKGRAAFLGLIIAQAAHSVEEYCFRLFDVLAPARLVSRFFSPNLALGFAIANTALVLLGLVCYLGWVQRALPGARSIAWFWAVMELANGIGHIALALEQRGYFPGLATAPFLLTISAYLISRLGARPVNPSSESHSA
jgi:hypothetical protein